MAFTDEFAEALADLEPDLNQSFTWAGADYPCFATGNSKGGTLEQFGYAVEADLIVIVRGAHFSEASPERGQTITFNNTPFRIDRVLTAPNSCFLRLACVSANRGA